jgi:hypothetical protein
MHATCCRQVLPFSVRSVDYVIEISYVIYDVSWPAQQRRRNARCLFISLVNEKKSFYFFLFSTLFVCGINFNQLFFTFKLYQFCNCYNTTHSKIILFHKFVVSFLFSIKAN